MVLDCYSDGFYIINNQCRYSGRKIPNPPGFNKSNINLTTINDRVYLNGYEFFPEQDKWKITFRSIWYYLF